MFPHHVRTNLRLLWVGSRWRKTGILTILTMSLLYETIFSVEHRVEGCWCPSRRNFLFFVTLNGSKTNSTMDQIQIQILYCMAYPPLLAGSSLLWVFLYGLIIIELFALISFAFYRELYIEGEYHCDSVYACSLTVLHRGLIVGLYEVRQILGPVSV